MTPNTNDSSLDEEFAEDFIPEGWSTPPSIEDLKTDLSESQSSHDVHVVKIQHWLDNLNITGNARRKKLAGKSNVQPQLIRKQAEWRYAALSEPFLATEDIFQVSPTTFEDKQGAIQNQLLLNYQFNNQIDKVKFIDEGVRTAVDEGTLICRVGWISQEEEVTREVPIYEFYPAQSQDQVKALEPYAMVAQTDPASFEANAPDHIKQAIQLTQEQGIPIVPYFIEMQEVSEMKLTKNEPTLEVCNFNNVIVDPSCGGDLSKAEFVIYSFETNLSELEKEGIYSNLDKIEVKSNSTVLGEPDHVTDSDDTFNFKDEPRAKFVAFEYWGWWDVDGSGTTTPIVATWVGDTLIRLEENPYPFKNVPFVAVQYLPVRREIYGEPDGSLLQDNQDIVGAVTRGAIDLMARSANSQTGMRKDALDSVNKRRYDKGQDYEFNPAVDPRQAIITHQFPEIPNSVSLMLGLQHNEAESLTGVKAFTGGISGEALGKTATSVRGALDAASKRELGILRRLAQGITEIGKMFIAMNGEFLSDEEIIRVTNEDFVAINREDLVGNYDLKLSISTAEEDNQKAQELAFMLQTMGNSMPQDFSQLILADIARLRKMPDLAKKIDTYQPQPDPMEEQLKMLEMQKLQAEIAVLQSQAMENQAEAGLDQARTGTEYAKQRETQSTTDQKDLDFLEQESGLKHTREVEQNGEQARSNMALSILKAELDKDVNRSKVS
jgi:hypothetical protein